MKKNSFSYEQLIDCANGDLFGKGNAQLPSPPMLMFDRITNINETGGVFQKGEIIAELDIKPVRWIDEVLDIVLTRQPIPWEKEDASEKVATKKQKSKKSSVKAH